MIAISNQRFIILVHAILPFVLVNPARSQCLPAWNTDVGTQGPNATVFTMASFDGGTGPALYAGGYFTAAGSSTTRGIARWNGLNWSGVNGTGTNTSGVTSMLVYDDGNGPALFVGGFFQSIDGVAARGVARWNGTSWTALGDGIVGTVYALSTVNEGGIPTLYAGGTFITAGGQPAANVARWKNNAWSTLGSGMNDQVYAVTTFDDGNGPAVFFGGVFTQANGAPIAHIAKWDGSTFSAVGVLGLQASDHAHSLGLFDDNGVPRLYAGGFFLNADMQLVRNISRWNGSTWQPFHNGFNGEPKAYVNFDDRTGSGSRLHVFGDFNGSGLTSVSHAAAWTGSVWQPLGAGLDNNVYSAVNHDLGMGEGPSLYVGGAFLTAGGAPTVRVARWVPSPAPAITAPPAQTGGVAGGSVVFSAQAVGGPTIVYQWFKDDSPLFDGGHVSGSLTDTLTINPATAADDGDYRFTASNTCGAAQSAVAALSVSPACSGDVYADARVDGLDVFGFVECILSGLGCSATDLDGDTLTADVDTDHDLDSFVTKLLRVDSSCP